jgi:iron complex transport system ATP-binding protein
MSLLAAADLSVGYPDRVLAHSLDLQLEPGECWAVLGNNGSGKSTLLHVLAGLVRPLHGQVRFGSAPVAALPPAARARALGLLLQEETHAFWGSVLDYVLLGRYPHRSWTPGWRGEDEAAARAAIAQVDLGGRELRPLAECSGGERQRARIALLLAQDPQVYLLDEPLLHLDLRHQLDLLAHLRRLARERNRAVMMVMHEPVRARRFCDRVLLLHDDGTCVTGPAEDLVERSRIARLYGCPPEEIGPW